MASRARRESVDVRRAQHRCADYSVSLFVASAAFNSGSLVSPRIVGSYCIHYGPGHPLNRTEVFYPDSESYMPPNSSFEPRAGIIARRALLQGFLSALVATKDIYRIGRASSCLHIDTSSMYLDSLWNEHLPDWDANGWPQTEPLANGTESFDVASIVSSDHSHARNSTRGSITSALHGGRNRNSAAPSVAGSFRSTASDPGIAFDPETGILVNEDLLRKVAVFRRNFFSSTSPQGGSVFVRLVPTAHNPSDRLAKEAARAAAAELTTQIAISGGRQPRRKSKVVSSAGREEVQAAPPDRLRNFSRPADRNSVGMTRTKSAAKASKSIDDTHSTIVEEPDAAASPGLVSTKRERSQTSKSRKEALAASAALGGAGAVAVGAAVNRTRSREPHSSEPPRSSQLDEEPSAVDATATEEQQGSSPIVPQRKWRASLRSGRSRRDHEEKATNSAVPATGFVGAERARSDDEPAEASVEDPVIPEQNQGKDVVTAEKSGALPAADEVAMPEKKSKAATKVKSPKKKKTKSLAFENDSAQASPLAAEEEKVPATAVVAPVLAPEKKETPVSSQRTTQPVSPPRLGQTRALSRLSLASARSGLGTDTENEVFDDARSGFGDYGDFSSNDAALSNSTPTASQDIVTGDTVQSSSHLLPDEDHKNEEPSLFSRVTGGAAAVIGLGGSAATLSTAKSNGKTREPTEASPDVAKEDVAVPRVSREFEEEINEAFHGIGNEGHNSNAKEPRMKAGSLAKESKPVTKSSKEKKSVTKEAKSKVKQSNRKQPPNITMPKEVEPEEIFVSSESAALADKTKVQNSSSSQPSTPLEKKRPIHPFERERRGANRPRRSVEAARRLSAHLQSPTPPRQTPSSQGRVQSPSSPRKEESAVEAEDEQYPRPMRRHSRVRTVGTVADTASSPQQANTPIEERIDPMAKSRSRLFSFGRARRPSKDPSLSSPQEDVDRRLSSQGRSNSGAGEQASTPPDRLVDYRSPEQSRMRTFARQKEYEQEQQRQRIQQGRLNSSGSSGFEALNEANRSDAARLPQSGSKPDTVKSGRKKRFSFFHRLLSKGN